MSGFEKIVSSLEATRYYIEACAPQGTISDEPILLSNANMKRIAEIQAIYRNYNLSIQDKLLKDPKFASSKLHKAKTNDFLRQNGCTASEDGRIVTMEFKNMKKMKLIPYDHLSPEEFEYLLLKSDYIMGCTGDMSVTQALSSGRMIVYEIRQHKLGFYNFLNDRWKEAGNQPDNDDFSIPAICINNVDQYYMRKITPCSDMQEIHKDLLKRLRDDSFQKWFRAQLVSALGN